MGPIRVERWFLSGLAAVGVLAGPPSLAGADPALPAPSQAPTEAPDSAPPPNMPAPSSTTQPEDARPEPSPPDMLVAGSSTEPSHGLEPADDSTNTGLARCPPPSPPADRCVPPPPPPPPPCCPQATQAAEEGSSEDGESFGQQLLIILTPLGILLKGWELSAFYLENHGDIGGTGLAGGTDVPLFGPMNDLGAVGGFSAYLGRGGNGERGGALGAMQLRLGLGLRTDSLVFALQGVGGLSEWREEIPASAEGGAELRARWMIGEWGPLLDFFAQPTWVTSHERRAASRLEGIHELTVGIRASVSREIPIAAQISYTEIMGSRMISVGFGSGLLDWIVDYGR